MTEPPPSTKPTTTPWPWAGDRPLDKARRTARSYRDALQRADPTQCADLDRRLIAEYGQTWLAPATAQADLEDWVTVAEAAQLVGLTPAAVYKWVHRRWLRGCKDPDKRLRVKVGDVLTVDQEQRHKRAARKPGT